MRQLKMFHVEQHDCCNCLRPFVPLSKDVFNMWDAQFAEEYGVDKSPGLATRVFDANMRFCSGECEDEWEARALWMRLEREQARKFGKRR